MDIRPTTGEATKPVVNDVDMDCNTDVPTALEQINDPKLRQVLVKQKIRKLIQKELGGSEQMVAPDSSDDDTYAELKK